MQDQSQQQIQQLTEELTASKSRSFDLIDNMTRERDVARQNFVTLENVIKQLMQIVGITEGTIEELMQKVQELAAEKETAKPAPKGKAKH